MNIKDTVVKNIKNIINVDVNPEDYAFLDDINVTPILMGFGGSYAYGTNVEGSDIDIRGIAIRNKDDILLNRDFEQIVNTETDTTIYSFEKMVKLLINCNPNTIEILGLRPDQYIYLSDIGKELVENKDMFLSKRCIGSFMGYANQQMYRLQQKSLVAMSEEALNAHICKTINFMKDDLSKNYNMEGIKFHLKDGKIVMDLNLDDYPLEDFSNVLGVINKTLRDYAKNSTRNEKAIAHNKISKHAMHLLRLYMMCEDILLYGEINTYRVKEHDLLMDIRNKKYLGEDGKPIAEFYDIVHEYEHRIEEAKKITKIPDEPNFDKINDFIKKVNYKIITA